MCNLPATGVDGMTAAILCIAALAAVVVGAALVRGARAGAAIMLVALFVAIGVIAVAPPAQAACPPAAAPPAPPPVDSATIGLIISDMEFRLTGPRTLTVDVENTSVSAVAYDVTLVGAPPTGVTVDASSCVTIAPAGSCSIVVDVSALATPFLWSYGVAGSNTNTIADSIHAWESTTLQLTPTTASFVIPGDSNSFTVLNTGSVDARLVFADFSGSDPGAYSVSSTTCGLLLVPLASCTVFVTLGIPVGDGTATLEVEALNADTVTATLTN